MTPGGGFLDWLSIAKKAGNFEVASRVWRKSGGVRAEGFMKKRGPPEEEFGRPARGPRLGD